MFTNVNNIWLQSTSKTTISLFVYRPVKKLHSATVKVKGMLNINTLNLKISIIQRDTGGFLIVAQFTQNKSICELSLHNKQIMYIWRKREAKVQSQSDTHSAESLVLRVTAWIRVS